MSINKNPLSRTPQKNTAARAVEIIAQDPAGSYRQLREKAVVFANGSSPLDAEKSRQMIEFITELTNKSYEHIVWHEGEFQPVWEFARLLHRLDKPQDAKIFIELAVKHKPSNPRVLARKAEIYLDLDRDVTGSGYNRQAFDTVVQLLKVEQSDYTRNLLDKAIQALGESAAYEPVALARRAEIALEQSASQDDDWKVWAEAKDAFIGSLHPYVAQVFAQASARIDSTDPSARFDHLEP